MNGTREWTGKNVSVKRIESEVELEKGEVSPNNGGNGSEDDMYGREGGTDELL